MQADPLCGLLPDSVPHLGCDGIDERVTQGIVEGDGVVAMVSLHRCASQGKQGDREGAAGNLFHTE